MNSQLNTPAPFERGSQNPVSGGLDPVLVARVYRYHLALCGDPVEAQQAAAGTLRRATRWKASFDPRRGSFTVWMFQFARYQQAYAHRRAIRTFQNRSQAADNAAFAWPEEEVRARASVVQLAVVLRELPRSAAETLALSSFGALDVDEIAAVTGRPLDATREQFSKAMALLGGRLGALPAGVSSGGIQAELRALAEEIQPETDLVEAALKEWDTGSVNNRPGKIWPPAEPGRWLFRARAAWQWGLRVLPAAAITAGLLVSMLDAHSMTSIFSPARTPQSAVAQAAQPPVPGDMVPPSPAVCLKWKDEAASEVGLPATLIQDALYSNPTTSGKQQNGRGCEVVISASGAHFPSTQTTLNGLADILLLEGFRGDAKYTCPCGFSGNSIFGRDWYGWGMHLTNDALNAVLTVSWRPKDASVCTAGEPASQCNLLPDEEIVTVRLVLAQPASS